MRRGSLSSLMWSPNHLRWHQALQNQLLDSQNRNFGLFLLKTVFQVKIQAKRKEECCESGDERDTVDIGGGFGGGRFLISIKIGLKNKKNYKWELKHNKPLNHL